MPETVRKPLNWFKDPPQIRSDLGDENDLRCLGESLRVRQLYPVLSLADGTTIAGFRRIASGRLVGLESLLTTIYESSLTANELGMIQHTENFHRLEMSPYDRWKFLHEMLAANPTWGHKELCSFLKMDPSAATKWTSPSKCIPEFQEGLKTGVVGITDCYAASQVPQSEQFALWQMKKGGASRDQLTQAVRRTKSVSTATVARTSRVTIPLGCGSKVVLSGRNLSMTEIAEAITECLAIVRDGIKRRLDAKLFQESLRLDARSTNEGGHHVPG